MQKEGLMEDLVKYLNTSSEQLKMLCANAIFRLAEEKESRHLVKYKLSHWGKLEFFVQNSIPHQFSRNNNDFKNWWFRNQSGFLDKNKYFAAV